MKSSNFKGDFLVNLDIFKTTHIEMTVLICMYN